MGKLSNIGPFKYGMNNRVSADDLPADTNGRACRLARNVVFTDSGRVRRRDGATLVAALSAPHSLAHGYYVSAGTLYHTASLSAFSPSLVKVLSNNTPLAYAATDRGVFASNGTDALRLTGVSALPWCPPKPALPTITTPAGTLTGGAYRVAISYVDVDGIEGPLSDVQVIDVPAAANLLVTHPTAPSGVAYVNTYASTAAGTVLQYQGQQLSSAPSQTLTEIALGRVPVGPNAAPLPAGEVLALHNARLVSASGAMLHYSEPYHYGLSDPVKNWVAFPAPITVMVSLRAGLFVCADKTYLLQGPDIAQAEMLEVLPYGAVKGSGFALPNLQQYGWYGARGLVVANDDGQASAVQEAHIAALQAGRAATTLVESNGIKSLLTVLAGTPTSARLTGEGYLDQAAELLGDL